MIHRVEHVLSILFSLFKSNPSSERLIQKFYENDYEKLYLLFELHEEYANKMAFISHEFLDEEEYYLQRLEEGLFTLHLVDLIILYLREQSVVPQVLFYMNE
jgi:beta-catenin-like protein 1